MLKNKNIIVTGSNRGIGLAIVKKCAKYGANIWACVRNISPECILQMEAIKEEYGVKIFPIQLDFTNPESINAASEAILSEKIPLDGLVNNAGITGTNRLFSMTSMEEIKGVFEVNFFGPMLFTQRLLKNMIKNRKGSIVNISSVSVFDGRPAQFEYITSKSAVMGASRKLAEELGAFGIRVNAVAPGITKTDMLEQMAQNARDKAINNSFLKRPAEPDEIAETVAFLISDRSRYITGQVIRIDGGGN